MLLSKFIKFTCIPDRVVHPTEQQLHQLYHESCIKYISGLKWI